MNRESAYNVLINSAPFLHYYVNRLFEPEHVLEFREAFEMALERLREAEPVRRGETGSDASGPVFRWKTPVGASWRSAAFICEKCGGKVYWPQAMRGENSNKRRCYYPTCPWCGAKMGVEAGDQ